MNDRLPQSGPENAGDARPAPMDANAARNCLLVLGMHRSGTSALARLLNLMGADLPERVIGVAAGNDTGHWEPAQLVGYDNDLLSELGSVWHDWRRLDLDKPTPERRDQIIAEIGGIIASEYGASPLFVLKDPRQCRLSSFMFPALDAAGINAVPILPFRNPLEVMESLAARKAFWPDGYTDADAALMWLAHVLEAEFATRGRVRVFFSYDRLLEDWRGTIEHISTSTGISFPKRMEDVAEAVDAFISPRLRHHRHKSADGALGGQTSGWIDETYAALQMLAADPDSAPALARLDAVRHEFGQAESLLARFALTGRAAQEDARSAQSAIDQAERSLQEALSEKSDLADRITALQQSYEEAAEARTQAAIELERQATANERKKGLARLAELEALRDRLASMEAMTEKHTQALRRTIEGLGIRVSDNRDLDQMITDIGTALEGARRHEHEAAALKTRVSELEKAYTAAEKALWKADAEAMEIVRRHEEEISVLARSKLDSERALHEEIRSVTFSRESARREEKRLHDVIDEIYGSTSWRVSAPVRWFGRQARRAAKVPRVARAILNGERPLSLRFGGRRSLMSRIVGRLTRSARLPGHLALAKTDALFESYETHSPLKDPPARVIAFYLPQFHTIPENDDWWGEGFTEWTNVRAATPQFSGHYQPHVPTDLGYYDLTDPTVQEKQVALARNYGIAGFCFYMYWFGGKRLLEKPVEAFLANEALDLGFCLCWANENWSRRWDGLDSEILIAQDHSPEDDLAFISEVSRYMRDPRYIRVDGKPMLLLYRPSLLPDARATAARWRDWCRLNGIGEIYLAYTQSFETVDPREYGFDAAVEFPPNNSGPPDVTDQLTHPNPSFTGIAYDWQVFVERSKTYQHPPYRLHHSVCPGWDNTARRKTGGTVFVNNTPALYEEWLSNAVSDTVRQIDDPSDRLVFVNAWNEWAEGAYLEPNQQSGYAYLAATRRALENGNASGPHRVVVVSHDAHPHGGQYLALNLCRTLRQEFGCEVDLVLLGEGALEADFAREARVHNLAGLDPRGDAARTLAQRLKALGADFAIANTTVSGLFAATLSEAGFKVVSLVHELPKIIREYRLEGHARAIAAHSDTVIAAADLVAREFAKVSGLPRDNILIRPQGAYKRNRFRGTAAEASTQRKLRRQLGWPAKARVVLGVGFADYRKGFDLFVELAERIGRAEELVFVWAGHHEAELHDKLGKRLTALTKKGTLILPGRLDDTDAVYAAADAYVLTSREDPFPTTVMEALDVGLPVFGFSDVAGTDELIVSFGGRLVPPFDLDALANALVESFDAEDPDDRVARAQSFWQRPDTSFSAYVHELLAFGGLAPKRVSVVVPNYNYGHFLDERIDSILGQNHPIGEIIVLDDASSDDSLKRLSAIMSRIEVPVRLVVNEANSGSVFRQWLKGAELARYDYLWIAEADDLCEPGFLAEALKGFADDHVVLSYTQSKQMAQDGRILCDDYLDYVNDVSPTQWRSDYVRGGADEIVNGLSIKNTIPNVSAVVFRRQAFVETMRAHLEDIVQYRVAGDWCTYVHLLEKGSCRFSARSLNLHRRHDSSVTLKSFSWKELNEIEQMQKLVRRMADGADRHADDARTYLEYLKREFSLN